MARTTPRPSADLRRAPGSLGTNCVRIGVELLEDRTAPALFTVGTATSPSGLNNNGHVATADFNADGKPDIVLTNYGQVAPDSTIPLAGQKLTVMLGDGAGGFGSPSHLTVGTDQHVTFVAIGDVTGDGTLDLVCTSSTGSPSLGTAGSEAGMLTVFQGGAFGTFSKLGQVASGGSNSAWVGLADVTGDGKLDAVVLSFGKSDDNGNNLSGNNMTVFQNNGTGTFSLINTVSTGIAFIPTAGVLGDFDADGKVDIVTTVPGVPSDSNADQPEGFVQFFAGNGAGSFVAGSAPASGGPLPIAITAADVNADGKQDLIVTNVGNPDSNSGYANFGAGTSVGVLFNAGSGSFAAPSVLTAGLNSGGSTGAFASTVADFDGDGKVDIATITYGHPANGTNARVAVFRGAGGGNFTPDVDSPYNTVTTDGQYLAAANFGGSTAPDLVVVGASNKINVLTNTTAAAAPTTTALTAPANPTTVTFGANVTFTATVTGGVPNGGTVTFLRGATTIGTGTTTGGTASFTTTTPIPAGTYSVTARYEGATGFATSTSSPITLTVNQAATGVGLGSSADPSNFGDTVTFTATVTSPAGNPTSGTVEFRDNGTLIGTGTVNAGGVATFQTSTLAIGAHPITAAFVAGGNYAGSTSTVLTQDVNPAAVSVGLGSSADPSNFGQNVTFTATVTSAAGNPTSGTVEFRDNGTLIGTGTVNAGGVATFSTSTLAQGVHRITATFLATGNYASGTSGTLQQDVNASTNTNTATSVGSNGTPSIATQSVTFTATVNPPVGGPTPTGSVQFFVDGVAGPTVGLTGNTAQFSTSSLGLGAHTVTATYIPTGAFNASSSSPFTQQVVVAPTGVGLGSSSAPSFFGQTVTFTATVVANPASMLPTGSVQFLDNGAPISGAIALVNNGGQMQATFQTSSLAVGSHAITAQYAANRNFGGSTSSAINQGVNKIGTTIVSLGTTSQPAAAGQPVTFTATIAANLAFAGMPTGT
ncbi:MAG TPA: Ig-like domain repeat protein, partial [Gemmataceae bacterium]|nr:Ig-like domain repeat protein [Gemmataceae bacterium]